LGWTPTNSNLPESKINTGNLSNIFIIFHFPSMKKLTVKQLFFCFDGVNNISLFWSSEDNLSIKFNNWGILDKAWTQEIK
jgi:hypothetical protein